MLTQFDGMKARGWARLRAGRKLIGLGLILALGLALAPPARGEGAPRKLKLLPGSTNNNHSWDVAEFGGALYFLVDGASQLWGEDAPRQLWKSDGTAAGTVLVKGGLSTAFMSVSPGYLTVMNGALYFQASDGVNGAELWKSDGTTSGTVMLKDICAGARGSNPQYLAATNGTLYFAANDDASGQDLWKTDGTAAGTVLVSPGSVGSNISNITTMNGLAFFLRSFTPSIGSIIYKSDGTASGTDALRNDPAGSGYVRSDDDRLTAVNGTLYFAFAEPWKSDGTAGGTVMLKDINPGYAGSYPYGGFTGVNGAVFFTAVSPTEGDELWKTDGTEAGTRLVKDIKPGTGGSGSRLLTNVNGTLYFAADDGVHGYELWKSDGTAAGMVMVKEMFQNDSFGDNGLNINYMFDAWGTLCFIYNHPVNGPELWKSDGTAAGTVKIGPIGAYGGNGKVYGVKRHKNQIFFLVSGSSSGQELWVADQTAVPVALSTFGVE